MLGVLLIAWSGAVVALEEADWESRAAAVRTAIGEHYRAYASEARGYDVLVGGGDVVGGADWLGSRVTLYESLDTLYVAGLEDEFREAVDEVFRGGAFDPLKRGVVAPFHPAPTTEFLGRVVGGLLGGFEVSGDRRLLHAATFAAEMVLDARRPREETFARGRLRRLGHDDGDVGHAGRAAGAAPEAAPPGARENGRRALLVLPDRGDVVARFLGAVLWLGGRPSFGSGSFAPRASGISRRFCGPPSLARSLARSETRAMDRAELRRRSWVGLKARKECGTLAAVGGVGLELRALARDGDAPKFAYAADAIFDEIDDAWFEDGAKTSRKLLPKHLGDDCGDGETRATLGRDGESAGWPKRGVLPWHVETLGGVERARSPPREEDERTNVRRLETVASSLRERRDDLKGSCLSKR